MNQKKIFQKLNVFADWFLRLVTLNIVIIFCSLPIVTLYPAISAGYNVLHDYSQDKPVRLFRDFFTNFKQHIGKKMLLGLTLFIVIFIGFTNIRFYSTILEENESLFYQIGYFVTLTLISVSFAVMVLTLVIVKVAPATKIFHVYKLALVVAGKFYLRTVAIIVFSITPLALLFTPITSLILVFMGVTLPLLGIVIITKPAVFYLESLGESND